MHKPAAESAAIRALMRQLQSHPWTLTSRVPNLGLEHCRVLSKEPALSMLRLAMLPPCYA